MFCGLHKYNEERSKRIYRERINDRIKVYGYEELFKKLDITLNKPESAKKKARRKRREQCVIKVG